MPDLPRNDQTRILLFVSLLIAPLALAFATPVMAAVGTEAATPVPTFLAYLVVSTLAFALFALHQLLHHIPEP